MGLTSVSRCRLILRQNDFVLITYLRIVWGREQNPAGNLIGSAAQSPSCPAKHTPGGDRVWTGRAPSFCARRPPSLLPLPGMARSPRGPATLRFLFSEAHAPRTCRDKCGLFVRCWPWWARDTGLCLFRAAPQSCWRWTRPERPPPTFSLSDTHWWKLSSLQNKRHEQPLKICTFNIGYIIGLSLDMKNMTSFHINRRFLLHCINTDWMMGLPLLTQHFFNQLEILNIEKQHPTNLWRHYAFSSNSVTKGRG